MPPLPLVQTQFSHKFSKNYPLKSNVYPAIMSRENTFDLQGGGPNGSIHLYRPEVMSFYASVEAVDRGLDPLATNLVVAGMGRSALPCPHP